MAIQERFPELTEEQIAALEGESFEDAELEPSVVEMEDGSFEVDLDGSPLKEDTLFEEELALADHNANLAKYIDEDSLEEISSELVAKIENDKSDRKEWASILAEAVRLLGLEIDPSEELPFEGACTASHPMLLEAITKFQAKAFSELFPAKGPVKTQIIGMATPDRQAQARRVQDFMNFQVQHDMTEYGPELDRLLFYLALEGSAFRKTYYDPIKDRPVTAFVQARDLVVPYSATSLDSAERVTHCIKISKNELLKHIGAGFYRDIELDSPTDPTSDEADEEIDAAEGRSRNFSQDDIYTLYEVHTALDLPGFEDVDPEGNFTEIGLPYIVTIESSGGKILSIRRNWREEDLTRTKENYFTHYTFVPGLGFYGYGYLHLIGGLAKASTGTMRQLIDAGTFATLPAGFKAHGMRVVGDKSPLRPGEFRDVQGPLTDISKSFAPLPFKEPSATLLNLLTIVIQAAEKFADGTEALISEAQSYGPVGTIMALLEQGGRLFSAIHKRLHIAQGQDFKILARLNFDWLPDVYPYEVEEGAQEVFKEDFDGRINVLPVSDPNMPTQSHRIAKANAIHSMAIQAPDLHNMKEVQRYVYEALGVEHPERFLQPDPPEAQPLDPISENINALNGLPLRAGPDQNHQAHIKAHSMFLELGDVQNNVAAVQALMAHVTEHIALDYRLQLQSIMGQELPPPGEPLPPEIENQIAQFAAEGTEMLVNGEKNRAAEEQMEDPQVRAVFEGLENERQRDEKTFRVNVMKTEIDKEKLRRQDIQKQKDREKDVLIARINQQGRSNK